MQIVWEWVRFWASFSLRIGQFSNPVATHPRTNEVEVLPPPPPRGLSFKLEFRIAQLTSPTVRQKGILIYTSSSTSLSFYNTVYCQRKDLIQGGILGIGRNRYNTFTTSDSFGGSFPGCFISFWKSFQSSLCSYLAKTKSFCHQQ